MTQPTFRKLKGYAFDPSFASTLTRRQGNEVVYKVRWEDTTPGPCGEYIEVIDYDPTKACFYEPVNLEDKHVLADYGLAPSEGDPRFHQQQVYAVAMTIIQQFEKALGRKIIWCRLDEGSEDGTPAAAPRFVQRLRIYPHALRQQNAFYSPRKLALLFGYFQSRGAWSGNNIPGAAIFTCLSPDIVAHEATHAILDSLHPHLRRATNPDMPAFHEGFADIIALLQRFTFTSVVEEQIRHARGDLLSPKNLLGDLAIQFGQAVSGNRRALRSFLVENDEEGNARPVQADPAQYHSATEPHKRGALLVAAVFDAFTRLYRHRAADLVRLASGGSGILALGEIDPDLVKRLSAEACDIAARLMHICIRALDYCPPVDLTYGDFLRSLITADVELNPDDEGGLRFALLEAFRSWGIVPGGINTYSVASLMWKPLEEYFEDPQQIAALRHAIRNIFNPDEPAEGVSPVVRSMEKILREENRERIFEEAAHLSAAVHRLFHSGLDTHLKVEQLLGMCFQQITYTFYDAVLDQQVNLRAPAGRDFQVYQCRPVFRYNSSTGKATRLLLITFVQQVWADLSRSPYEGYFPGDRFAFRGGASLIIDLATFEIRYAIVKRVASTERLQQQLDYALRRGAAAGAALLMQEDEPFAALHLH